MLRSLLLHAVAIAMLWQSGSLAENCLSWALRQRLINGGRLLWRRSEFALDLVAPQDRHGLTFWLASRVPHILWADPDGVIWQYTPKPGFRQRMRGRSLWVAWWWLWFFDGEVRRGDHILGESIPMEGKA